MNLRRIGTPKITKQVFRCRVCSVQTHNPTMVCHACSGRVVGKPTDRNSVIFHEIGNSANEWEYFLPRR